MVVFSDELGRAGSGSGKSASDGTRDENGLLAAADVQTAFALHHRAVGDYENAAASCRAALEFRPDYPEALNNLGLALHALGRHDEALAQFDAALALRPDFAMAHNNRGTTMVAMGDKAKAAEAYRAAIAVDSTLALAHANLGRCHNIFGASS